MFQRLSYYFEMLARNPLDFVIFLLYELLVISISFSFHEYAHARVAFLCGDPTARNLGRMTLDPQAHLSLTGTLALFFLGFGWGKPVPVVHRNFKHKRRWLDDFAVSVAGITMNFLLFLACLILSLAVNRFLWEPDFLATAPWSTLVNPCRGFGVILAMDGITDIARELSAFSPNPWLIYIQHFLLLMALTNLTLAIFNFLPIPPLDGFHMVNDLLFKGRIRMSQNVALIVQYALLALVLVGVLTGVLSDVVDAVYTGILKLVLAVIGQT
ncbi:MAG: site-2 protease family protein [Clostridia bacterium]|nr:site-2 protease family protein [Clostridia bacterium]